MVGARIVTDGDDELAMLEVLERDGALADADRFRQTDAGPFTARVGAIGKVVGAVLACEQLIEEGRLVGRPARGIELGHVRVGKASQYLPDPRECRIPGDGPIGVAGAVVSHGMRHPAFTFQLMIRPLQQGRYRVRCKEFRRRALPGGLPTDGLGAVLAELEGRALVLVRPWAAGTVETLRRIGTQQQRGISQVHLLADGARSRAQRTPAAGGAVVCLDTRNVASCRHEGSLNAASGYLLLPGSYQTASILCPSGSWTKAAKYPGE